MQLSGGASSYSGGPRPPSPSGHVVARAFACSGARWPGASWTLEHGTQLLGARAVVFSEAVDATSNSGAVGIHVERLDSRTAGGPYFVLSFCGKLSLTRDVVGSAMPHIRARRSHAGQSRLQDPSHHHGGSR